MSGWLSLTAALAGSALVVALGHRLKGELMGVLVALGGFSMVGLSLGHLADRLLLWLTRWGGGEQ